MRKCGWAPCYQSNATRKQVQFCATTCTTAHSRAASRLSCACGSPSRPCWHAHRIWCRSGGAVSGPTPCRCRIGAPSTRRRLLVPVRRAIWTSMLRSRRGLVGRKDTDRPQLPAGSVLRLHLAGKSLICHEVKCCHKCPKTVPYDHVWTYQSRT